MYKKSNKLMSEELKNKIIEKLEDMKAENIISIDISKLSSIADYVIVATGRSGKHLSSTADEVIKFLKEYNIIGIRPEGKSSDSGWMAIDAGAIIIHLFTQEVRDTYKIEELWNTK